MRRLVSAFAIMGLLATTARAQNRLQFGGLSAWELTKGVAVQTTCEVKLIDEVMDEVYCFSSAAAKASFARDLEGHIVKALAAYEPLHSNTGAESSSLGTAQLSPQVRAQGTPPLTPAGCVHVTTDRGYPGNGYFFYCGSQGATYRPGQNDPAKNAASTIPPHLKTTLQHGHAYLYVFRNVDQFLGEFPEVGAKDPTVEDHGVSGYTYQDEASGVIRSAVFEHVRGVGPVSQPDMVTTTKHEVGHALDLVWGKASAQAKYQSLLASDWKTLNGFKRSALFPNGLPKPYPPTWTNEQIVKDLWPRVFAPDPQKGYAELYAWEFCAQASCNLEVDNPYYPALRLSPLLIPLSKFPKTRQYFKELWYNENATPF
jgi:hypothetical protein